MLVPQSLLIFPGADGLQDVFLLAKPRGQEVHQSIIREELTHSQKFSDPLKKSAYL
jgi:hypothetical protein